MAHYAFINENNIVTKVITGRDESDVVEFPEGISSFEELYGNMHNTVCKRTSYNTVANTHTEGGTPFRGNYAGIGYIYDEENDVFYSPKPYDSWTLNTETWTWQSPVPHPNDGQDYVWNENLLNWEIKTS